MRSAIWTILVGAGPAVGAAMAVGLIVALLQALTQIQEMMLTFVPKILVIFLVLAVIAPFIGSQIYAVSEHVYARIERGF
jgi:flagellar biosynthetic protein FliQ